MLHQTARPELVEGYERQKSYTHCLFLLSPDIVCQSLQMRASFFLRDQPLILRSAKNAASREPNDSIHTSSTGLLVAVYPDILPE